MSLAWTSHSTLSPLLPQCIASVHRRHEQCASPTHDQPATQPNRWQQTGRVVLHIPMPSPPSSTSVCLSICLSVCLSRPFLTLSSSLSWRARALTEALTEARSALSFPSWLARSHASLPRPIRARQPRRPGLLLLLSLLLLGVAEHATPVAHGAEIQGKGHSIRTPRERGERGGAGA